MAGRKPSRDEIDRFSGHAITKVTVTPAQKKAIAEIKSQMKRPAKSSTKGKK